MSLWSRIVNVLRGDTLSREIDEELQSHVEEAIANGRDPDEVRRSFGSPMRVREESRDIKFIPWLDSLRADVIFGWRQILKNKTASGAAMLSLGLAIGACTSAFRLIDAMLLRPLPVSDPGRLRYITFDHRSNDGSVRPASSFDYPAFRQLRSAVKESAEVMAISHPTRIDITYGSDGDMEKAQRQYISGWTLTTFGLTPAAGRLLTAADDITPGAHPYAVLSHDYWSRRFGRDAGAIGRKFRIGADSYEIAGVLAEGFTGTETGTVTDIFLPTMMNAAAVEEPDMNWFRAWVQLRPGVSEELVRQKLEASLHASRREKTKTWSAATPRQRIEHYVTARVSLERASAGVSWTQDSYRRSLWILAVLVVLVLLIACANVANLMTAEATARAREMALRVSIGAGRARLVQLVLIEGALIAISALTVGGLFAWWAAPFVVSRINPPDNPVRLVLAPDWRLISFAAVLTLAVTLLFALAPALRASAVKPVSALKGGDPHSRRRLINLLVAAQVTFCFLVYLVAGLFVSSLERMASQPTGFTSDRVLVLDTMAKDPQAHEHWDQVLERLRSTTGVEAVGLSRWGLMSGSGWNQDVWAHGRSPDDVSVSPYFHGISPGWLDTMKIPLLDGRDFRSGESYPAVAIVNQAFAREYFGGENPVGKSFQKMQGSTRRVQIAIVGYVRDARYADMREPIRPTVYVPFRRFDENDKLEAPSRAAFVVRAAVADPLQLASILRHAVPQARSEFYVSNIRTQEELVRMHTIRERLLATLSLFFAVVALLLGSVGQYGVLHYAVEQRRREIGIRLALGAQPGHIVSRLTGEVLSMLLLGATLGLGLGIASERYIGTLLFGVKTTDFTILAIPVVTIITTAVIASLPPLLRAVQMDPLGTIRPE